MEIYKRLYATLLSRTCWVEF